MGGISTIKSQVPILASVAGITLVFAQWESHEDHMKTYSKIKHLGENKAQFRKRMRAL